MDYSTLGKRIRDERQKNRLTQAELAEKVNVTTAYIGQIERGERKLGVETLVAIACVLNISIDYLLRDNLGENNSSAISEIIDLLKNKRNEELRLAADILKSIFEHIGRQQQN